MNRLTWFVYRWKYTIGACAFVLFLIWLIWNK